MLYVSMHIPKTAGSTLREMLRQRFGDRLQLAYDPRDGHPIIDDPMCIHGHGVHRDEWADLYAAHPLQRWFAFVREPLASAISGYYQTVRSAPCNHRGEPQRFDDPGLLAWLTHDGPFRFPNPPGYNHNRFTKWFARRPFEQFDFVGVTERFDESIAMLDRLMGWEPITYESMNVGGYDPPDLPTEVVERFRQLNADDIALYQHACQRLDTWKSK